MHTMNTTESELQRLLDLQRQAHAADPAPAYAVRWDRLQRLGALIDAYAERFTAAVSQDFGNRSATETTLTEIVPLRAAIRHAQSHLRAWMRPRRVATAWTFWPGRSRLLRQPLGVVGIVSPWNYPLLLALSPLVDVLAAGNRALLKPSELTPLFADALQAAVAEFFRPDEVAVLTGDAALGQAFCAAPFDHLVFTGSTAVGRLVAQAAAKNLTPVTLELGGKSPAIVDASCDLGKGVERLAWGKLINAGQTCIAPDYALVPRPQLDGFVAALRASMLRLYPRFAGNPDYTSIASERHLQRLHSLLDDARQQGATLLELEPGAGRQMAPVLLLNVHAGMRVLQEEIFGPLLPIVAYDTLDEAIAFVNARDKPLALYWFGSDSAHRDQVLAQTLSGGVSINDCLVHLAQDGLPFGGVGPSGQGHYHGEYGFRQFSKEKPVFLQSRWSAGGLVYPPYTPRVQRLLRWLARRA